MTDGTGCNANTNFRICRQTDAEMQTTETTPDHSVQAYKQRAKRLRTALEEKNITLNHGQCLDLVARIEGMRDWNTLSARCDSVDLPETSQPACPWQLG